MQALYPLLFVLLWSTGFVGARYGLPYAEPLSFLLVRYGLVIILMLGLALISQAQWPRGKLAYFHLGLSGILLHAVYLGGVFVAIKQGLPAGVTALVVGLQPLLTALGAGYVLHEKVQSRQWLGLLLGLLGVSLVISSKFAGVPDLGAMLWPALVALLAITAGTLYQKRFCPHFDLRTGAVIQFIPCAVLNALAIALFGEFQITWTGEFIVALGWSVLVLSVGAISLLHMLIRHGSAVNVASLFYLVPVSTAVIAAFMFGETLHGVALFGMACAITGVYLARQKA